MHTFSAHNNIIINILINTETLFAALEDLSMQTIFSGNFKKNCEFKHI